ncbi:hypothetical protein FI667_g14689, partial [Globisporangium splendens]
MGDGVSGFEVTGHGDGVSGLDVTGHGDGVSGFEVTGHGAVVDGLGVSASTSLDKECRLRRHWTRSVRLRRHWTRSVRLRRHWTWSVRLRRHWTWSVRLRRHWARRRTTRRLQAPNRRKHTSPRFTIHNLTHCVFFRHARLSVERRKVRVTVSDRNIALQRTSLARWRRTSTRAHSPARRRRVVRSISAHRDREVLQTSHGGHGHSDQHERNSKRLHTSSIDHGSKARLRRQIRK